MILGSKAMYTVHPFPRKQLDQELFFCSTLPEHLREKNKGFEICECRRTRQILRTVWLVMIDISIGSTYRFVYLPAFHLNVCKYTIHGSYGIDTTYIYLDYLSTSLGFLPSKHGALVCNGDGYSKEDGYMVSS